LLRTPRRMGWVTGKKIIADCEKSKFQRPSKRAVGNNKTFKLGQARIGKGSKVGRQKKTAVCKSPQGKGKEATSRKGKGGGTHKKNRCITAKSAPTELGGQKKCLFGGRKERKTPNGFGLSCPTLKTGTHRAPKSLEEKLR